MADHDHEQKSVQRAATATAPTAASAEGAMHETRMNVTRQRRAAMRKAGSGGAAPEVDIPEGGGKALDGPVKQSMEKKLGADLSGVNIHTGGASANASEKLNARAFTVGNDVHFNAGQFDPGSKEGTKLLAHELTHVVQGQKGGVQKKADAEDEGAEADAEGKNGEALEVSAPEEPAEQEADAVAEEATADMGEGGAEADGQNAAVETGDAGGEAKAESQGEAAATEEKAPEAGAKIKAPISAKLSASALRKLLRKKTETKPAEAEAEAATSDASAEPSTETKDEEEPQRVSAKSVAAKLHRKVYRYPAEYEQYQQEAERLDAEAQWTQFVQTLPGDLRAKATPLAGPEREALKKLGLAYARPYLTFTAAWVRQQMGALDPGADWERLSNYCTIALNKEGEQSYFEGLGAGPESIVFRDDISPDERKSFMQADQPTKQSLLTDTAARNRWKSARAQAALPSAVIDALAHDPTLNLQTVIDKLSTDRGSDRLIRISGDPQLPPSLITQFIKDVFKKLTAGATNVKAAMEAVRNENKPAYSLKGNPTSADSNFASVPLVKAYPLSNVPKYGEPDPIKVAQACAETAPPADAQIPRGPDGKVKESELLLKCQTDPAFNKDMAGKYWVQWARQSGDTSRIGNSACDIKAGRAAMPTYWVYDQTQTEKILAKETTADEVSKALAIDESPEYQQGALILQMKDADKQQWADDNKICRPTALDGLQFDQFQPVDDPSQAFGVTQGGVGEVVVGACNLTNTTVKRVV